MCNKDLCRSTLSADMSAESVDRQRSLLHMIQLVRRARVKVLNYRKKPIERSEKLSGNVSVTLRIHRKKTLRQ